MLRVEEPERYHTRLGERERQAGYGLTGAGLNHEEFEVRLQRLIIAAAVSVDPVPVSKD